MKLLGMAILALVLGGCGVYVPARLQVTDVSSGRTYDTYSSWGKENMLGYSFYDAKSGQRVMLKSYEINVLEPARFLPPDSPEAAEYKSQMAQVNSTR